MYCSQCVCFRVCPDKHPHGTVLFSTRSGDAFSPGQSHMCPLLQGVHLHQCFHGWLWCKKHKGSTKAPQTISCFIWVRFLKHRALCLNRFGCKALLLLLSFYLLPLPVSWHLHIGASHCRMERETIWFLLCIRENYPAAHCTWHVSVLNTFSCRVVIPRLSRAIRVPQGGSLSRHITWKPFSLTHAQASTLEFLIQQFWDATWTCVFSKCSPGNSVKFLPDSALGKHQCKLFSLLKS